MAGRRLPLCDRSRPKGVQFLSSKWHRPDLTLMDHQPLYNCVHTPFTKTNSHRLNGSAPFDAAAGGVCARICYAEIRFLNRGFWDAECMESRACTARLLAPESDVLGSFSLPTSFDA
jgi:hypothetical protein